MNYEQELQNAVQPRPTQDITGMFPPEQRQVTEVRQPQQAEQKVDYAGYAGLAGLIAVAVIGMLFWKANSSAEAKLKSFLWAVFGASSVTNLYAWGVGA